MCTHQYFQTNGPLVIHFGPFKVSVNHKMEQYFPLPILCGDSQVYFSPWAISLCQDIDQITCLQSEK